MRIIAKHLDRGNLKYPVHAVDTRCAFTGEFIREAVKVTDLVSDVFTDWEYVKYPTGWASIDAALCIGDVLPGKTRNNALRNYSFFATENELRLLGRESILDILLNIPKTPFRVAVTFNNKKHTSYKTVENTDTRLFTVTTDIRGNILFWFDSKGRTNGVRLPSLIEVVVRRRQRFDSLQTVVWRTI